MARVPKAPSYYASRGAYYVVINRTLHRLAVGPKDDPKVKREAWDKFDAKIKLYRAQQAGENFTMTGLHDKYVAWLRSKETPDLAKNRLQPLRDFVAEPTRANMRVRDLEPHHIEEWLGKSGNQGVKRRVARAIVGLLNWAVRMGYIALNPIADMSWPPTPARKEEPVITDAEHALFLHYAKQRGKTGFVHLLEVMYDTGACPGEIVWATAADYNHGLKTWTIGFDGRRRVIYLTPRLVELVERLNNQYPQGSIFRNQVGCAFSPSGVVSLFENYREAINRDFAKAGKAAPIGTSVTAFSYHHRFVTDWLLAGKPIGQLATLLGTSVAVLQERYWYIPEGAKELREALNDFSRSRGLPATSQWKMT